MEKPNCYDCVYRGGIPGDCHSVCSNENATVVGSDFGIRQGWFIYPANFDPTWLKSCDGFKLKRGLVNGNTRSFVNE